jgi:hypothetical protein
MLLYNNFWNEVKKRNLKIITNFATWNEKKKYLHYLTQMNELLSSSL